MEKEDMNCIFCKIVKKMIPGNIIYEDKNILAFNDINPQAPIHILVIPKEHIPAINDIESVNKDVIFDILMIIRNIAKEKNLHKSGYRVVINSGVDAGQAVQHLHFHILGGRKFDWPPG